MSSTQVFDRARLEQLRDRLQDNACTYPHVDAVVVSEPGRRRNDAANQAREVRVYRRGNGQRPPDYPLSCNHDEGRSLHPDCTQADVRSSLEWTEWIPPDERSLSQLGFRSYRRYYVDQYAGHGSGSHVGRQRWDCLLFGPPADEAGETAARVFEALASEAAHLILGGVGKGNCPTSGWLIHLADRDEPLHAMLRRKHLVCTASNTFEPRWVTVNPRNPWCWWAARLTVVFQRSRDAVQQFIGSTAPPPARVSCEESDRSVYLDGKRVAGEVELGVFRFFKVIAEAYPDPITFSKIRQRARGLDGKHRTRDLKDQLPSPLHGWVMSGKQGYSLKLPTK